MIITSAMRRLAHANPANLETLALIHEDNHPAGTMGQLAGVAADAPEEHLGNLRGARLISVGKTDAGEVYSITDEGRKSGTR